MFTHNRMHAGRLHEDHLVQASLVPYYLVLTTPYYLLLCTPYYLLLSTPYYFVLITHNLMRAGLLYQDKQGAPRTHAGLRPAPLILYEKRIELKPFWY